ncbi:MAG: hypothetical protein ACUVXF_02290 [Desulfobaccales bacterium]
MDTFDSQGKVLPIGAADQGILTKKVTDKEGQKQAPQGQQEKKAASPQPPEEEMESPRGNRLIDIVV